MMVVRALMIGTITALAAVIGGCGGGGADEVVTGSVSGTVSLGSEAITSGRVEFYSSSTGIATGGDLGKDGRFTLKEDLPIGTYKVSVTPPPPPPPEEMDPDDELPKTNIPIKFNDESSTSLNVEVVEGENDFKIDLTGDGQISKSGGS